jgi:hypothetical protein
MTRKIAAIAIFLLASFGAAGQTPLTYTVPAGTSCTATVNGCTLHNLTTTAPTITPWGWFVGGVYYTQFDFQLYQGQNAAAGATYCEGNGVYAQTPRPDLGTNYAEWKLDCTSNAWTNAGGPGEVPSGPYHIVIDLIAHWYTQTVIVYRGKKTITVWAIDQGAVNLTPIS